MGKSIQELMTGSPTTVESGASVVDAAKVMERADTGIVPVVDGGELVGAITDRDIAIKVVAAGKDPQATKVSDIASRNLVTVRPEQELDEALKLMAKHQVRRLPVVDDGGKLVGIVSQADVAEHARDEQTGELVEEISK
jgi:CBS domain-containing protein